MTTISSATGAISALTSYYQAQTPAPSSTATPAAETPLASAMINLVQDNSTGSSPSSLLGTGTAAGTSGTSTLSTLLSLASSGTSAASLINDIVGQTGTANTSSDFSNLLSDLGSTNGPAAAAPSSPSSTSGSASTTTGTQQQAIMNALAGAYSQSQQNLLSLLV